LVLGKEVWLIFLTEERSGEEVNESGKQEVIDLCSDDDDTPPPPTVTLRLHFGMSGSLVLNASPTPRERSIELLRINFSSGTNLVVYGDGKFGSVTLADASIAEAKLSSLSHLDICSSSFDPVRSVERIKKEGEVTVAKALLDQDVCPGVGNIIKQEALHRAKVHPKRRVKDISHEDLKVLVRELRDFSMKWYLQSRPESIVYNRTDCGECGGKVRVVKDDDTANRVTFYCEGCCEGGREGKGKKKQKIEEKKPFLTMRGHTCNGPSEKLQRVRKQVR